MRGRALKTGRARGRGRAATGRPGRRRPASPPAAGRGRAGRDGARGRRAARNSTATTIWPASMPRLKPEECRGEAQRRQVDRPEGAGEAEAVDQPEGERHLPAPPGQERPEIVERGQDDGGGDGALDQPRRQIDHAQDGQGQAEAVGEGERGQDLDGLRAPRAGPADSGRKAAGSRTTSRNRRWSKP